MTAWIICLFLVLCSVLALQYRKDQYELFVCDPRASGRAGVNPDAVDADKEFKVRNQRILNNTFFYLLENTSDQGFDYVGCGKLTRTKMKDDERLFETPNFYTVQKTFSRFQEVGPFIVPTLQQLGAKSHSIGPVAVILRKLSSTKVQATYLFPNFTKEGEPLTGYNAIAKAHRWYHRTVYGPYYKYASTPPGSVDFCKSYTTTQCPGVPVRIYKKRPANYGLYTRCFYVKNYVSRYDSYYNYSYQERLDDRRSYYDPYDYWEIYNYYTACGTVKDKEYIYYTIYTLNPYHSLFDKFSIDPRHNISFLSEYEGMMYGCEYQLVSPQRKYFLVLETMEDILSAPGLALYQVISGDPILHCRNNKPLAKKKIWKIYLSKGNYTAPAAGDKNDPEDYDPPKKAAFNYAHFKIESGVIYLVDKDTVIWSYKIADSKSPAIVQLNDEGALDIFDSYNEKIDSLSIEMMKGVAAGFKSSRYFINENWVLEKERLYQEMKQKNADKRTLQEKDAEQQRIYSYNKDICPIGLTTEESFAPF